MELNMKIAAVAVAVLLAAAVAGACGGDDDDDATPTPAASETAAASATPADGRTPAPTGTPAVTEAGIAVSEYVIRPDVTRANYGTVIFKVRNEGAIDHQFVVVKTDLGTAELPRRADGKGVDETLVEIAGRIDLIAPGDEEEVSVEMDLGKYVIICNLYANEKSHYLTGMYNGFTIANVPQIGAPTQ